jgi:hypothetical protein
MVMNLQSLVDYKTLKILQVYEGTCFGHVMFKICQYATNDDKIDFCECERFSSCITKNNYMDKELSKKEVRVGEGMHG